MYKKLFITLFISLLSFFNGIAQITYHSNGLVKKIEGTLLNQDTKEPLPYANVIVLHKDKGSTTNETGYFSINNVELKITDTISFHYIGYQPKSFEIKELQSGLPIFLKEEIVSLSEFFVFANNHNAEDIIKNVIKNKNINYKATTSKKQLFIRQRFISDIGNIDIKFQKSSFSQLDEKMTRLVEKKIPKHSISYTDFLGDAYFSKNNKDTVKINPIKVVSLKDKSLADLDELELMFKKIFENTKENEYWKIKSGIIGGKVDVNEEDSIAKKDSLNDYYTTHYYAKRIDTRYRKLLNDKDEWDFLYHTGDYEYTLIGGTKINGEDVYIINFRPKKGGKFIGKVYVSIDTYALVKADYHYDIGKTGTNIHLLGIGYTKNQMDVSVYFEKNKDNYQLKYYAKKIGNKMSFDRNVSLLKKKKRFLIDKELNEIKVRLNLSVKEESSVEMLILNNKDITNQNFIDFKQKNNFKIIYVDQFNDDIWKGYNIIEPTKQMRDYKKIE
ncbi:MAG: carboxypeptidase-like regulatory domain-containing protein [Bacteroidetes bacterium]|nr:carboxypeptidase-like regulatory domain-containing protein [Bacteroidota bacterium]